MRISDWSSDVCSSDLTKFRYLTDFLDLGLQCAACRWMFVEKDHVIRMLGEFWPDIFVILLVCSLVSFANQKFGIFVATQLTFGSTALTLLLRRSEEHTSELQSLMRISYAVLYLKK